MGARKHWWLFVLFFLLITGSFLVYSPHQWHPGPYTNTYPMIVVHEPLGPYDYPLHLDGWNHLAQARSIVDEQFISDMNPQIPEQEHFVRETTESGFHILLGVLSFVTDVSLPSLAPYLPAFFFFLGGLLLFIFFFAVLRRPLAGLIAVALLTFIPSNVNILGPWFLVPLNLSLMFLSLFLLFVFQSPSWKKTLCAGGVVLIVAYLTYPFAALFTGLFIIPYVFMHRRLLLKEIRAHPKISLVALVVALLGLFFLVKKWGSSLLFGQGWTHLGEHLYALTDVFPVLFFVFAVVGVVFLYRQHRLFSLFVGGSALFFLALLLSYAFFEFTVLFPYQRALYFLYVIIIIAASYALGELILLLSGISALFFQRIPALLVEFALLVLVLVVLFLSFMPSYYDPLPGEFYLFKAVDDGRISLLQEIPDDAVVLADPFFSTTIYPLSGHFIVGAVSGNLDGRGAGYYDAFKRFDCEQRFASVDDFNEDYVIIDEAIECDYFHLRKSSDSYFLYWFDRESFDAYRRA